MVKSESWRGLENAVAGFQAARRAMGGQRPWLRAVRRALGISAAKLARRRGVRVREIFRLEGVEWDGRVTLGNLRRVAEAMDCVLVYAVVPRTGSVERMALRARVDRQERREKKAFAKKCVRNGINLDSAAGCADALRFAARLALEACGIHVGPRKKPGRPQGWKRKWGLTRLGHAEMLQRMRRSQRTGPGRKRASG